MLLALLLQVAVPPGPPPQPPATMVVEPVAMLLAGFDADGDGKTTRAEMEAGAKRTFAAIDTAWTGKLGYIAFADWAERWLGDRNALPSPFEVDSDGDNQITLAELTAQLGRTFDRLDRNRDGALTRAELLTIRASSGDRGDIGRGKRRGGRPPQ
ncbi:EF-hand domain-containing protein [uncultured Sphingomonas sp.]|uniref:EF-hand domain-containing protein n=1 Tax=uncultured Sphingomonas sp. TaxID=158754 RepID=UPI0035CB04EF